MVRFGYFRFGSVRFSGSVRLMVINEQSYSEGRVSRLQLFLPLNDRLRVVKSGSDLCLSHATLKCWPLLLGTQERY
jgi:hypothetical protein